MYNCIICSYQKYNLEAIKILNKQNIVKPKYWFTNKNIQLEVNKNFPDVITHNYIDLVKGKLLEIPFNYNFNFDKEFFKTHSYEEFIVMNLLERNNAVANSFDYIERKNFYYRMLNYWQNIIKYFEIDMIIFEEEPHQASDYILYIIAKHLQIKTIIPIRTMPELGFLITDDILKPEKLLNNKFDDKLLLKHKISKNTLKYINTIESSFQEALKKHLFDQQDLFYKKGLINKISEYLIKLPNYLDLIFNFESDQKEKNKKLYHSNLKYYKYIFFKLLLIQKKKNNLKYYNKIISKINHVSDKYIFFCLQYQPEKSTCPQGGYFVDQYLAIKLISESIPSDWKVYVKEHPSSFVSSYARYGDNYRNENFYDKIKKLKNVRFVSTSENSYSLIDNCQFTASVGGTVCFESIIRLKPSLLFGNAWYNANNYIFKINNSNDIKEAIDKISGEEINKDIIDKFIRKIDISTHKGVIGGENQLKNMSISSKNNAIILAGAITEYLNDKK